ncbi:hypothetical protein CAPTEDRAFT_199535 [Capitella teleta]|uniref:Homeobox domain-containing protein n=1 Tax=Capitella teleta TaxID=283909 RepID=R7UWG7_CAPTE|nr:hypothetical protein CAPTEDRAFT_199535 [Capitella teleta]|eukprot:ELU07726.1 hypothetical protein CAPTEDRAFT_199535 [Capitella teleta]
MSLQDSTSYPELPITGGYHSNGATSPQDFPPPSSCEDQYSASFDTEKDLVIDESAPSSCVASPLGTDSGVASSIETTDYPQSLPPSRGSIEEEVVYGLPSTSDLQRSSPGCAYSIRPYAHHYEGNPFASPPWKSLTQQHSVPAQSMSEVVSSTCSSSTGDSSPNRVLEQIFLDQPYPSKHQKETLAHQLFMSSEQVKDWFQRRRNKERKLRRQANLPINEDVSRFSTRLLATSKLGKRPHQYPTPPQQASYMIPSPVNTQWQYRTPLPMHLQDEHSPPEKRQTMYPPSTSSWIPQTTLMNPWGSSFCPHPAYRPFQAPLYHSEVRNVVPPEAHQWSTFEPLRQPWMYASNTPSAPLPKIADLLSQPGEDSEDAEVHT